MALNMSGFVACGQAATCQQLATVVLPHSYKMSQLAWTLPLCLAKHLVSTHFSWSSHYSHSCWYWINFSQYLPHPFSCVCDHMHTTTRAVTRTFEQRKGTSCTQHANANPWFFKCTSSQKWQGGKCLKCLMVVTALQMLNVLTVKLIFIGKFIPNSNSFVKSLNSILRIGRTGRFGRSGIAINFVDGHHSMNNMRETEQHFGHPIVELINIGCGLYT